MLIIQKRDRETITVQPERAMTQRRKGCVRAYRLNITFQTSMQEWVTERNSIWIEFRQMRRHHLNGERVATKEDWAGIRDRTAGQMFWHKVLNMRSDAGDLGPPCFICASWILACLKVTASFIRNCSSFTRVSFDNVTCFMSKWKKSGW